MHQHASTQPELHSVGSVSTRPESTGREACMRHTVDAVQPSVCENLYSSTAAGTQVFLNGIGYRMRTRWLLPCTSRSPAVATAAASLCGQGDAGGTRKQHEHRTNATPPVSTRCDVTALVFRNLIPSTASCEFVIPCKIAAACQSNTDQGPTTPWTAFVALKCDANQVLHHRPLPM